MTANNDYKDFVDNLILSINSRHAKDIEHEDLEVTSFKKEDTERDVALTLLNKKTNKEEVFKYRRKELRELILKHTVYDRNDKGEFRFIGLKPKSVESDYQWLTDVIGLSDCEESEFEFIKKYTQQENEEGEKSFLGLVNAVYADGKLRYTGDSDFKSILNGMSLTTDFNSGDKATFLIDHACNFMVSTPQLIDGKYITKRKILGSKQEPIAVELTYNENTSVTLQGFKSGISIFEKTVNLAPSNPAKFTIAFTYPAGTRLNGKFVDYEKTNNPSAPMYSSLQQIELHESVKSILKSHDILSKLSVDFFIVDGEPDGHTNFRLEERSDGKKESFARSFYIGERQKLDKAFYNLVSGVESDKMLFKVFTRGNQLNIIHEGKPTVLEIHPEKGYGFNIDFSEEVVIFNLDPELDSTEEMHETLTGDEKHIKLFHVKGLAKLVEPTIVLLESEQTRNRTAPVASVYCVVEKDSLVTHEELNEVENPVSIKVKDENNQYIVTGKDLKHGIVFQPSLCLNMTMDEDLNLQIPEINGTSTRFAYQFPLLEKETVLIKNGLAIDCEYNVLSFSDALREPEKLGLGMIGLFTLDEDKDIYINGSTVLSENYPLEQAIDEHDVLIEFRDGLLKITTKEKGCFVYRVNTSCLYISQYVFNETGSNMNLFDNVQVVKS